MSPIVVFTVSEAERDLLDTVAAGAVGYLTKSTRPEDLRVALAVRSSRGAGVQPAARRAPAGRVPPAVVPEQREPGRHAGPLSPREREVLAAVARGRSNREIAEELYISPKTVENHVRNTMAKLHLNRRHELIRWAVDRGIA